MSADYEIGYGKPPQHTRFQKGRSGNPRGRPKGSRNLKSDLGEELGERVKVREGTRQRSFSRQRALVKALVTRAIQGDQRAALTVFSLVQRLFDGETTPVIGQPLSQEDQEVYALLHQRLRSPGVGGSRGDGNGPGDAAIDAPDSGTQVTGNPDEAR